jgi:predicted ArsR family transcriptional regulator
MEAIESLPIFSAARRDDPATSKAAAASSEEFKGDHAKRIVEALAAGPAGKTEIGSRSGLTEQQVARRMHELLRTGAVERTGRAVKSASGCPECEYRRTEK